MSTKYKIRDRGGVYFISFSVINWIDVFIRNEYKAILIDSWRHCQDAKGFEIYGWVIMPSHVHMIVGSNNYPLDKIIGEMKRFTSGQIRDARLTNPKESRRDWMLSMMHAAGNKNANNNNWQFWQQHSHPIPMFDSQIFHQKLLYIHLNPVRSGFVDAEEKWLYSSAADFHGKRGMIELASIV